MTTTRRELLLDLVPIISGQFVDGDIVGGMGKVRLSVNVRTSNTTIAHGLGRIPNGCWVFRNGNGGVIYDASNGTASWDATNIVLRSTVDNNVCSFLFF